MLIPYYILFQQWLPTVEHIVPAIHSKKNWHPLGPSISDGKEAAHQLSHKDVTANKVKI